MNLEKKFLREFESFLQTTPESVPEATSQKILKHIRSLLFPNPWMVFSKLAGIHGVVSIFSLAICDQFGMSPFRSGFSLSQYFMKFGHSFCMVACGTLFIGLSVLLAWIFLTQEEFKTIHLHSALFIFVLGSLSLGFFAMTGALTGTTIALSIAALWLSGAYFGGVATVKLLALKAK